MYDIQDNIDTTDLVVPYMKLHTPFDLSLDEFVELLSSPTIIMVSWIRKGMVDLGIRPKEIIALVTITTIVIMIMNR